MPDWSYQTLFRPLLFTMPPEQARDITLGTMGRLARAPGGPHLIEFLGHMQPEGSVTYPLLGMDLISLVGIDSGLDAHTLGLHAIGRFGVGFIEAGPLTERPVQSEHGVRRRVKDGTLWYPDLPVNDGVDQFLKRLGGVKAMPVPMGIRLAHQPGALPAAAAAERCRLIHQTAPYAHFFTLESREAGAWSVLDWTAHLELVLGAIHSLERSVPTLLCLTADMDFPAVDRLLAPALHLSIDGVMISGGSLADGGRLHGQHLVAQSVSLLHYLRHEHQLTLPIIAAGGVHEPLDALILLEAGATAISLHSGLVFSGPGLPKRINEAVLYQQQQQTQVAGAPGGTGWIYAALMGAGLCVVALTALLVAITRVLLPYDESFVGLTKAGLTALTTPRLLFFMAHDRISFVGATAAVGVLYLYIALFGMRSGEHWASAAFRISGVIGFLTFFLFLGYGYLDPLHLALMLILLPLFVLALRKHRNRVVSPVPPGLCNDHVWRTGLWGQLMFVGLGAGMIVTGLVIAGIGITHVFVATDLTYMHTTVEVLRGAGSRVVPLIAHDRTGFGGALITNGVTILLLALWGFRRGAAWQWWALFISGTASYTAALWTHVVIGYLTFIHLLPVYMAMAVFVVGIICSFRYLTEPQRCRT